MPAQVATLAVGLVLKTGPFFAALGGTINKASSSLMTFGFRLSAATAPLIGLGVAIVKIGTEYETAFTGVLKAVEEATDSFGNLTALGEELRVMFRDLSMEIPMSAVQLANLGAIAGQLGIAGKDLEGFVEIVAKLGVTTNLSAEEPATGFARLMTIMGTAQDQMDELASTLVYLGNNTAALETEILRMAMRFAGTASIIGMSEKGILALAAAMSSAQIRAEMGGTAISRVMIDMANAIAENGEQLKLLADVAGLTTEEFATLFEEDAEVAILAFVEGLAKMDEQGKNVFKVLEDLGMAEIRVRETLLKLAASHEKVREAIELSNAGWEENIALDREFNLYAMTTKSLLELLKSRFKDVAISIKDAFDPAIKSALVGIVEFLDGIVELARTSPELLRTMVAIAAAIVAIGPALLILGGIISVIGTAATVVGAALSPVGLVIMAIVAAVSALGLAWTTNFGGIQQATTELWQELQPIFEDLKALLLSVVNVFSETVGPIWAEAIDSIRETLAMLGIENEDVWNAIKFVVKGIAIAIGLIIMGLAVLISGGATAIVRALEMASKGFEIFGGGVKKILDGIKTAFQGWIEILGGILTLDLPRIIEGAKQVFSGWFSFLEGVFNAIVGLFLSTFGAALNAVAGFGEGVLMLFENLYDNLIGHSIVPDMVRDINASLEGLNPMLGGLMELTPAPVAVPAVAGGFAGQLVITNYWDASISSKDRLALEMMMKETVYGALGETYGG